MSEQQKCPKCGIRVQGFKAPLVPIAMMELGGELHSRVRCIERQLAQAEERVADLEVALSFSDSNTKEAQERAERAEGEAMGKTCADCGKEAASLICRDCLHAAILQYRGVDFPCKRCQGLGVRAYGDTSTWRHGIGGQAITGGVCDECWGTGDINRKGYDLRGAEAENTRLREELDGVRRLCSEYAKPLDERFCAECSFVSTPDNRGHDCPCKRAEDALAASERQESEEVDDE